MTNEEQAEWFKERAKDLRKLINMVDEFNVDKQPMLLDFMGELGNWETSFMIEAEELLLSDEDLYYDL